MKGKSFPYYVAWQGIFGSERASGDCVEDVLEARAKNRIDAGDDFIGDYHVNLEDILETNKEENSVCQSEKPAAIPSKNKGQKRKSIDGIEKVCDVLSEISRNTNLRLEVLASRIGVEQDMVTARMEVFEKLGNIPGLSMDEKLKVGQILVEKVERLQMFMGLPEDARGNYVCLLLNP